MAHRPYPNRERAHRQLERHRFEEPPLTLPTASHPGQKPTAAALEAQPPLDEYRLSTH